MIKNVRMKNFKCFRDGEIKLGNITILAGANASGKSSVIQSILLYFGCETFLNADTPIDVKSILGIDVGGIRNLIFQRAESSVQDAFCIDIDGNEHSYSYDQRTQMDLKVHGGIKSDVDFISIWYLNAERIGPRISNSAGGIMKIQSDGSNAIYLMDVADSMKLLVPKGLMLDANNHKFSRIVEMWMNTIVGDIRLSAATDSERAKAELRIKNQITEFPVVPTMTGFGISYVLPIVVAGLFLAGKGGGLLLVENPEAHLHPSAQSNIGKFLAFLSQYNVQVIVETHSEHVIDGARIELYKNSKTDLLRILYLSLKGNDIRVDELILDKYGEISDWPKGFFDQKQLDLMELFEIRRLHEK